MTTATAQPTTHRRPGTARALIGTGAGNALEWFDWNIYAIFATYFAAQFFNDDDKMSALLSTLAVFAVGFVARPFGGLVFGWISDHRGRKFSMSLSISLAAVGSLVIGLSPTYALIGSGASAVLLVARLVQGLAHGGELPSAQTYISEYAPADQRGKWSSLIYISGTTGVLAGTLLAAILSAVLDSAQMASFGWRIPFVVGGLFGLYSLYMRLRMTETTVFQADVEAEPETKRSRTWRQILSHKRQVLQVIGLNIGMTVVYYTWAVAAPAHAISSRGIASGHAFWAGVVANVIFIALLPVCGMMSDRIGRRPVLLTGTLGAAALLFPLDAMIGHSAIRLALAMSIAMVFIAMVASILPCVLAEMFPTHIRTIAVGIPYSVAVAAFGGTAPYLQELIGDTIGSAWFTAYVVVLLLISSVVAARLAETRGKDLHDGQDAPTGVGRSESTVPGAGRAVE